MENSINFFFETTPNDAYNKYKVLIDAYMQILKFIETERESHFKYQKS